MTVVDVATPSAEADYRDNLRNFRKPSAAFNKSRVAVREATSRFSAASPRVFDSVVDGTDCDGSDLDLLVDALPGATLFDVNGLQLELEELPGLPVDLLTPAGPPAAFRERVLAQTVRAGAAPGCPTVFSTSSMRPGRHAATSTSISKSSGRPCRQRCRSCCERSPASAMKRRKPRAATPRAAARTGFIASGGRCCRCRRSATSPARRSVGGSRSAAGSSCRS